MLQLRGVVKLPETARNRNATRVTRPPNHRIPNRRVVDKPVDEVVRRGRRECVADRGHIFINQGCVNEGIFPRQMPWNPIADHRSELTDLQIETPFVPRRYAYCIFIKPDLGAVVAGLEAAIDSRLREEINLRPQLRVKKKREARIEEIVD